jgi:long-chain acyl-CoA synthetase
MAGEDPYAARPWLSLYEPGVPADLKVEHRDGLSMLEATVRRCPEGVAIFAFGEELTWRQVDADADALAAALAGRGIRPGDRVVSFMQNLPEAVLTLVAAWKLGAILVPASPMLREAELARLLVDSGAVAAVAEAALWEEVGRGAVAGTEVRVAVAVGGGDGAAGALDFAALLAEHSGERVSRPDLGPDDIALLTYTSGTTGPPKGAMNTHGNVAFSAQVYRDWVHLGPDDVILGAAPLFHITGLVGHVAAALISGAELALGGRFEPGAMLELAAERRTTFTVAAITAFVALWSHPDFERFDLSALRKILSGGAAIPAALVGEFERRLGAPVHNIYGMTETTSPSHCVPFGSTTPVDATSGALSVGLPVPGTVVRVVDPEGREVAPGEVGELVTAGPQVVPGYWQREDATAAAFPGGAIRTGDVGYMSAEGWFFVIDRIKDLINVSGYKVWPREVEDVLFEHPAVREAAVVGAPDSYRGEVVVAALVLEPGAAPTEEELREFCKGRLAAYKCPRRFEFRAELPRTLSGKVQRRYLRG